ncbi:TetR/AcrR family transcriptional regulator [Rhodococcus artemisiae]|uniref:TetR/AcrR family transcriptional regulator n=1 Tax=Rhodococcus artemisiae TaxID=714159 RepID=A0ABU7L3X5_9NOCA|nr:TetR/AcrR family transcriptional regulator [Rhodococcus artemisiae]MEE2056245.1 TetR/AcrR family transcriptional regulator [Rhodococcus artemisiae]
MPKLVDHAERRRELVWALWAVIHERGIDGVTFQAVAVEAGVSIGRIQHYFESKHHLIRSGAQEMVSGAEKNYRERGSAGDPRSALAALLIQPVPTDAPSRVGVSVWYAYLAKATNDPWIRSFLAEASRGTVGEAERLLRRAGLSEVEAHGEAMRLVALSNGATQSVLVAGMDADGAVDLVTREIDRTIGDVTGGNE